ncbi:unnamed protein product [Penicillium glandicola]
MANHTVQFPNLLSTRARQNVEGFLPKIATQMAQRSSTTPPIDLSTAENKLIRVEVAEYLKQAVQNSFSAQDLAYQKGFTGAPQLVSALAGFFNGYFRPRQPVLSAHIAAGPGAGALIDSFLRTVCNPGDGMLVLAPYWSGFHFQFEVNPNVRIHAVGGDLHCNDNPEQLLEKLNTALKDATRTGRVAGLVCCNPHNPLGRCFPVSTLQMLLQFCQANDLHFLSDEVYALSIYDSEDCVKPEPFVSVLSLDLPALGVDMHRVHVVWSASKDLGANGLRVGGFVSQAHPEIILGVALGTNMQVSALSATAMTCLLSDNKALDRLITLSRTRLAESYCIVRQFFRLHRITYVPAYAGMFVWARLLVTQSWDEEMELQRAIAVRGVAVSAGRDYASEEPGWYRLSFGLEEEELKAALEKLGMAIGMVPRN